jgi:hypothetical protein
MTIEELNIKLGNVIADLQGQPYGNVMVQVASDALFLVKDRVINRGTNPDNEKMEPYSTSEMYVSKSQLSTAAYQKIAGTKTKRAQLQWIVTDEGVLKMILPYGYKQFRDIHGRQTRHVDYTFSGRMWNNIKLLKDRSDLNGGVAVIGATTRDDRMKVMTQIELRGVFLRPTKQDTEQLRDTFSKGISNIFKKNGLTTETI